MVPWQCPVQVELDKHAQLLDEWMELIKELDAVLRYGFTSQVEPPKPGTLDLGVIFDHFSRISQLHAPARVVALHRDQV